LEDLLVEIAAIRCENVKFIRGNLKGFVLILLTLLLLMVRANPHVIILDV